MAPEQFKLELLASQLVAKQIYGHLLMDHPHTTIRQSAKILLEIVGWLNYNILLHALDGLFLLLLLQFATTIRYSRHLKRNISTPGIAPPKNCSTKNVLIQLIQVGPNPNTYSAPGTPSAQTDAVCTPRTRPKPSEERQEPSIGRPIGGPGKAFGDGKEL